jgi:hypothetical protein
MNSANRANASKFQRPGAHFGSKPKTHSEFLGIDRAENAIERVVRGNAVGEIQKRLKPIPFGMAKILHVVEGLPAAQPRAQTDQQHNDERMLFGPVDARIVDMVEVFDKTLLRMQLHPYLSIQIFSMYKVKSAYPSRSRNCDPSALAVFAARDSFNLRASCCSHPAKLIQCFGKQIEQKPKMLLLLD